MTGLQLTRRQYYALCTMVLLSPLLHLVPRKTTAEAGCGGWLCALAALVPLLLFAWMLEGILHRGRPGEGIGEITLRALGPVAGRVLLGVYALWFLLYSAFALRIGAERFIEAVFPLSRPWPFVVTILTMAVCGALGSTKALFRASEIFLPLLMLVLALVLVFAAPGLNVNNLLPVTAQDLPGVARSGLTVFGIGAAVLFFGAFTGGHTPAAPGRPNFDQDLTLRFATGLYYQSPFYKELRRVDKDKNGNNITVLNKDLKSQRSIHFILGGDYTFRAVDRNFKVTAEMYYKKLDNLNPYTVDNVKIRYYGENCAKGYAMGLDVKFFGEFVPGTDSWISFSLMKAQQTIRETTTVPMANSQGYNISLFFQDYFPGYKRVKLNLKGVLSGGLPQTIPGKGYEAGYFRTPAYKRVDIGLSYQLAGGTDAIMDRGFFRHLKNIWLGLDVFNILDIKNVSSYYWITDVYNVQYAVPNYLTGRQLNVRLIVDF